MSTCFYVKQYIQLLVLLDRQDYMSSWIMLDVHWLGKWIFKAFIRYSSYIVEDNSNTDHHMFYYVFRCSNVSNIMLLTLSERFMNRFADFKNNLCESVYKYIYYESLSSFLWSNLNMLRAWNHTMQTPCSKMINED